MSQKIYTIDATGKALGRIATEIATILIGKHKPDFVPYKDTGDKVIVKNVNKIKFSGKKILQKKYYHHTKYPGHLRSTKLADLFEKNPAEVLRKCVLHMLPKNKLIKTRIKKLKIE